MSKEKLQDIKDVYSVGDHAYIHELRFLSSDIDDLMKIAYNQALEDVMQHGKAQKSFCAGMCGCYSHCENPNYEIDKQSILKLKI